MTGNSDLAEQFQNQRIHDQWESVYRDNPRQRSFNDRMMKRFLRCLQVPAAGQVLDAGCGVGDHTCRFAQQGFHSVGVDLSEHVLQQARRHAENLGLSASTVFIRAGLEDLQDLEPRFDAVHCRGVLMHIPRWRAALAELCRLLRPGGRILVVENNVSAVESLGVRLVRLVRNSESRLERTPDGWVFHNDDPHQAPITRIANIRALTEAMRHCGVQPETRFATEFWDINRFPAGLIRNCVVMFNRAYFSLRLPARWALGNAIIGRKNHEG
jgi:ubiquinone/menaquinone biosynthesis C-methylase UbiE